ncbi:MAG: radical SAM family heme chaperone HemW [Pseudomonadota bacterium]
MDDQARPFGAEYGFGAYIHWPYCARICPYCDFNVYAAKDRDNSSLLAAITTDIARHGERLSGHPNLTSIYFGGGTPSLLSGAEIAQLIDACETAFGVIPGAEITLEANPHMVTPSLAGDWRAAGVNRLSLGVQSLQDEALTFLGRDHSANDARIALDTALEVFSSVSIDLIYARPDQHTDDWVRELTEALALGAQHVSLYELTIEPATPFGKAAARGTLVPMTDDTQADLFELTHAIMSDAGCSAYEISNFARAANFRSQHNLTYWRSGDWIGVGPGAHGRLSIDGKRYATEAARRPNTYMTATRSEPDSILPDVPLSADETAREILAMGLRTIDGIASSRLEETREGLVNHDRRLELQSDGWLIESDNRLTLTPAGRLLADKIVAELLG